LEMKMADLEAKSTGGLNWKYIGKKLSFGRFFQVGDQILPVLGLLQTAKGHLGSGNVLLWVLQIDIQGVLIPGDPLLFVGISVRESFDLASLPAKNTVQIGTDLVSTTGLEGVTLCTASLGNPRHLKRLAPLLASPGE